MKTFLHIQKPIILTFLLVAVSLTIYAQPVPELVFQNPTPESGNAGADGAVYRFPNVAPNVDALVTIAGRSSSQVRITSMDLSNMGYQNAFQPQISFMYGNAPSNSTWSIDFDFNFVVAGTLTPTSVLGFNLTALDIDGDGGNLNEFIQVSNAQSYLLENNSLLSVENLVETIHGVLTSTRKFNGPRTNFYDIDVTATRVMTTLTYANKSFFRLRAGGSTRNGSSSSADRMYSFWFKGFDYNTPVQTTLPVRLSSFTALLNNKKVDLKWTTASEINVSHFIIEKSTDGINYADAGMAMAYGNTSDKTNYSLSDNNINTNTATVIYYRIRSIDIDGKSQLSETRIIRIGKENENSVSIFAYPNPVSNEVRITIPAKWQNKFVSYEVISVNGQPVRKIISANSSQTETINTTTLTPGFYFVRVICEGQVAQQKIIKN